MSIFQIGQQSKYLQVSPGCRKYISPFLLAQQKQDIQKRKQQNQFKYRQVLINQMKQKQKQKYLQKKKENQQDIKHQKQFYEKIRKYKTRDIHQKSYVFRREALNQNIQQHDIPTYQNNLFKKQKQLTFPTLMSPYYSPKQQEAGSLSIFSRNEYNKGTNDLKNNSLIQIGRKLRKRQNMSNSLILQDETKYQKKYINTEKYHFEYFESPTMRQNHLRNHLRQKQREVYDLIQKSTNFLKSTKNPIRQLKKRLRTQPIYIPVDQPQEQQYQNSRMRYRIRTQFGSYTRQDDHQRFYRLPFESRNGLDFVTESTINSHDERTFTLGQQFNSLSTQKHSNMIKIQQNPENQENYSSKKHSARFNQN